MAADEERTPGVPLGPGQVIAGRYRLLERLGDGSMGEVFRARDLNLDRDVAIKRLHQHLLDRRDLAERFEREGRILARLRHPGIIQVHDMFEFEGTSVLVLELVEGTSFADLLGSVGHLPWNRCVDIGVQVCSALQAAHEASVIHRDIKPANILVSEDGTVHVADFGIARLLSAPTATAEGAMVGTPHYWAPEQATHGAVGPSSDLYSLCCVLFEAACGRPPFVADEVTSPAAVFLMHVVQPVPDPRDLVPGLSDKARIVLMHGLAKDPAERFQSAAELGRALAEGRDLPAESRSGRSDSAVANPLSGQRALSPNVLAETRAPSGGAGRAGGRDGARRRWRLRGPSRRQALIGGLAGLAIVLVGGALGTMAAGGRGGGGGSQSESTREVTAGHVQATVPASWKAKTSRTATLAPFELRNAAVLAPPQAGEGDSVVVGTSTASGPSLAPAGVDLQGGTPVKAGRFTGYRYPRARAAGRQVTAYVAPTSDGVLTVLCPAGAATPGGAACTDIVSTLRLVGAHAFPLPPDSRAAASLRRVLRRADLAIGRSSGIASAASATSQAQAADAAASGLRGALEAVPEPASASPSLRPALRALAGALEAQASGYEGLADAARAGDSQRWSTARQGVEASRRRLDTAMEMLRAAGYDTR